MFKNNYYICHYCCNYYTHKLKDIKQHTSRKNKCKCNSLMSYDECMLLSISKKFIYTDKTFNLLKSIVSRSYAKGAITESEFITLIDMLGKDVNEFNDKGYIEKSIVWFFAEIISDQL